MSGTHQIQRAVLVTGASDPASLGAALAIDFLQAGYRVIATCRAPLERIRWLEIKGCSVVELDLVDQESVDRAATEVNRITGGILDILINNVGVFLLVTVFPFPTGSNLFGHFGADGEKRQLLILGHHS